MPHSALLLPLPIFVDKEAWAGFVEMRVGKGKRVPFTERAAKLILAELYRLKASGQDPNACLDQSTIHGWAGVYPVKGNPQPATQAPKESFQERNERQARERVAKWAPSVAKKTQPDEVSDGNSAIVVRH